MNITEFLNVVQTLFHKVESIEQLLIENSQLEKHPQDDLLTVSQAAEFLNLAVPTIYGLISKGEIPNMKRGKRCYFLRQELLGYIRAGRRKTNSEIEEEADQYLVKKKGVNHA